MRSADHKLELYASVKRVGKSAPSATATACVMIDLVGCKRNTTGGYSIQPKGGAYV
jgi:hypothetical protein